MSQDAYLDLRRRGLALAGGLRDLSQRACVYHHLYKDSGERNVFPLIAAHGALWAAGYFKKGMRGGKLLAVQYALAPWIIPERLHALSEFADKFRDINRRVCAESYALYFYSKMYGDNDVIRALVGNDFSLCLQSCHQAGREGRLFGPDDRESLFRHFFVWEQENIVAPAVTYAYRSFEWPSVKYLARRPQIRFAYFGSEFRLVFQDFSSFEERMSKGVMAYRRAEEVGFSKVEAALQHYNVMPEEFFCDSAAYYLGIERTVAA